MEIYRSSHNQNQKAKLTHLLHQRLLTDIPPPSNILRTAVPVYADHVDIYDGLISEAFAREKVKASARSARNAVASGTATERDIQKATKNADDPAGAGMRRKVQSVSTELRLHF